MYKLHIQNEKVRANIALIIETIRHLKQGQGRELHVLSLSFALNPRTGLLQIEPLERKLIDIHLDVHQREVCVVERGTEHLFDLQEIDPQAQQVLSETCHYLKLALGHLRDIHEIVYIQLDPSMDEIKGKSLIHEAWHGLERKDAELILLNTMPGTYLFRKDRFAGVMEEILSAVKKSRIFCLTLTYLDPEGQVRDKTIVTWKDHWLFYDDDPTLSGNYFQSLEDLLFSMGSILKRPLPAVKIKTTKTFM
ncbi:MAG: hypothetical protein JSS10_07990 [Verrucomicrobia bacterium]|nr:hypothetical protein [Verrucomicrobiota bacterium]